MNSLGKTTITTLEVAEMMEVEHWELLRKLEGRTKKDGSRSKGYIELLADNHLVVTDYFVKSTYMTVQNKEMPCYEVTKLGCDFLANKSNGEKGVVFTARYVKRFYEMEKNGVEKIPLDAAIAGNVADLGRVTERIMKGQGSAPHKIAETFKLECMQFGIVLPSDFVKVPEYIQMELALKNETKKEQTH